MPKRNPFTAQDLKTAFRDPIKRANGADAADNEITAALGRVNQQLIINGADADVVTEEWDRVSDINGTSASLVLRSRKDIPPPPAKVYLVKNAADGRVIFFQPFKPRLAGQQPMTDQAEFDSLREDHRLTVVNDRAAVAIKKAFADELEA